VIINNPFHPSYHGGLQQFLLDLEEAYAKLDKVADEKALENEEPVQYIPDSHRLEQLRNKLLPFEAFHPMLSVAQTQKLTFLQALEYFRNEVMTIAHAALSTAKMKSGRRINIADNVDTDETETVPEQPDSTEDYHLTLMN